MPRLAPPLLRSAQRLSPSAAALLPACRDLPSALNELRWIREHVRLNPGTAGSASQQVERLCRLRSRGVPLQYVLGTQPFGALEMRCRPGVLIPRCVDREVESDTWRRWLTSSQTRARSLHGPPSGAPQWRTSFQAVAQPECARPLHGVGLHRPPVVRPSRALRPAAGRVRG